MNAINVWQPLDSRVLQCTEYELVMQDCKALLFNGTVKNPKAGTYQFDRTWRFSLAGKPMQTEPKSSLVLAAYCDDTFLPIKYPNGLVITEDRYVYGNNDRVLRRVYDEVITRHMFASTFEWMEDQAQRQAMRK